MNDQCKGQTFITFDGNSDPSTRMHAEASGVYVTNEADAVRSRCSRVTNDTQRNSRRRMLRIEPPDRAC